MHHAEAVPKVADLLVQAPILAEAHLAGAPAEGVVLVLDALPVGPVDRAQHAAVVIGEAPRRPARVDPAEPLAVGVVHVARLRGPGELPVGHVLPVAPISAAVDVPLRVMRPLERLLPAALAHHPPAIIVVVVRDCAPARVLHRNQTIVALPVPAAVLDHARPIARLTSRRVREGVPPVRAPPILAPPGQPEVARHAPRDLLTGHVALERDGRPIVLRAHPEPRPRDRAHGIALQLLT